jgi:hypothetical protein
MDNRIHNEIALGTNVYSQDWANIQRHLTSKSQHIIAGDFSNFDGSLNSQILFRIIDVISGWYNDGEENALIRRVLGEYLFNSTWILRGHLVQLNHSQPSGNPLTTLINCMYNMFIFRYVYLLAKQENNFVVSLADFTKYIKGIYYGDDSVVAIAPSVIDWFNQHTITALMKKTGHVYTDETKSGNPPRYRCLHDVTFLKREFRKVGGEWLAPLSRETIQDMIMWMHDTITDDEAVSQTTRMAAFEASLHGAKYFDYFTKRVKEACLKANTTYGGMTFQECVNFINYQTGSSSFCDADLLSIFLV